MFVEFLLASTLAGIHQPGEALVAAADPQPEMATPEEFAASCTDWDDWEKSAPAFAILPRLAYIGTCGITVLLLDTPSGQVLFDTGTQTGGIIALTQMEHLGIDLSSVAVILASHEHFDHVGGMADVSGLTGAPVLALPNMARVLRTGTDNPADPQAGMHEPMKPVRTVVTIDAGEPVLVGGVAITPIATPGHTPGATSWHWKHCVGGQCWDVVYADSLSPVSRDGYRFSDNPEYVAVYRAGLKRLRETPCDVLLTPHPSASRMVARSATGSLAGGMTCIEYADAVEARLAQRLTQETAQ